MDEVSSQAYEKMVGAYVNSGSTIVTSEYTPLGAINNPLKRGVQALALTDIDFFRRLAQTAMAVELYYPPGINWQIINEVPAFTDMLGLDPEYALAFHNQSLEVVKQINQTADREVIVLTKMDDYLWGTPEREKNWQAYQSQAHQSTQEVLSDSAHPEHQAFNETIDLFTYPMATCINPFNHPSTENMTLTEISAVYEALRTQTASQIKGVSIIENSSSEAEPLNKKQEELLVWLMSKGRDMAIQYRITMEARECLEPFKKLNTAVKYTMVSKRNKPVLLPNSGRGATFPAHGEPVFLADGTVTPRPALAILSDSDNYTAWMSQTTGDILYFTENS